MKFSKLPSSLGIRSSYNGFDYIAYAMELCLTNGDYMHSICKGLYTDIAQYFHTNPKNVEHCIWTAIDYCWERGNKELLNKFAGYPLLDKPTNSEFIDILYQHLLHQEKHES